MMITRDWKGREREMRKGDHRITVDNIKLYY